MVASGKGNLEIVKILVEKGADVNKVDSSNYTALMWATSGGSYGAGHLDIVKYLSEQGADLDVRNEDNRTAYDQASGDESEEIQEYLTSVKK